MPHDVQHHPQPGRHPPRRLAKGQRGAFRMRMTSRFVSVLASIAQLVLFPRGHTAKTIPQILQLTGPLAPPGSVVCHSGPSARTETKRLATGDVGEVCFGSAIRCFPTDVKIFETKSKPLFALRTKLNRGNIETTMIGLPFDYSVIFSRAT